MQINLSLRGTIEFLFPLDQFQTLTKKFIVKYIVVRLNVKNMHIITPCEKSVVI